MPPSSPYTPYTADAAPSIFPLPSQFIIGLCKLSLLLVWRSLRSRLRSSFNINESQEKGLADAKHKAKDAATSGKPVSVHANSCLR